MDDGVRDTNAALDDTSTVGLSVFEIATARWLHVEEIISLLTPETTPLSLSTSPPTSPPPSGTLLLYDRSVTRKYKADGHEWIKKRNSPKVREDHVKLRYQGAYRVAGSYVHSARTGTLHRRAYRLLDAPGTPPGPTQNWVLLHYLDTLEAAQVSALFADHLAAAASRSGRGGALAYAGRGVGGNSAGTGGGLGPNHAPSAPPPVGLVFRPPTGQMQSYNHQGGHGPLHQHQSQSQQEAAAAMATMSGTWPEYAKHVAAATAKVSGSEVSRLPQQQQLADPSLALGAGLKPASLVQYKTREVAVAAAGHDLLQQQQVAAERMGGAAGSVAAAGAGAWAGEGEQHSVTPGKKHHQRESSLDDGTMDVLWNMVMEEGAEDVDEDLKEAAATAIQQHMTPVIEAELVNTVEDAIQDVAVAALEDHVNFVSDNDILQAVEQVMTEGSLETGTLEDKVVTTLEDKLPAQLEKKLVETMEKELAPSQSPREADTMQQMVTKEGTAPSPPPPDRLPQTPLPEVIDFTPNDAQMDSHRPTSLVISTSASLPMLPPDDLPYRWHLLAAFVDMSSSAVFSDPDKATSPAVAVVAETDPTIMKVALAPLRKLTPFSYKCEAPDDISIAGSRSIILVGVRFVHNSEPLWDAIRLAVKVCIQAEWQVASDLNVAQASVGAALVRPTFYAPAGGGNVQLLSQLSQDLFSFYYNGEYPNRVVVGLPPSVGGTSGKSPGENKEKSSGKSVSSMKSAATETGNAAASSLPAPAPAMASVADAMQSLPFNPPSKAIDVAPTTRRKRTLSSAESPPDLTEANQTAEDWLGKQDPNALTAKTLGETVDRHCKIRFVERLANAAAMADPDLKTQKPRRNETVSTDDESSFGDSTDDGGAIELDASKLQTIDEDMLDTLLDSVLIKFVESLVDTCASEEEIKKEINIAGYAGFALLHYAALYNMKSLIPLLLKKGADPDLKTLKGGLTPLHLAAGAGHDQICDLLCRSGATVDAPDSFGLIPADHAIRNGFAEIGKWLVDQKLPAQDTDGSAVSSADGRERRPSQEGGSVTAAFETWAHNDQTDDFLQSAFKGLPLKDKLGLNLFVQKYRRKAKRRGSGDMQSQDNDDDGGSRSGEESMDDSSDTKEEGGRMEMTPRADKSQSSSQGDNSLGSSGDRLDDLKFISEKDREALKVAMSMMSKEEQQELERSAPYSDVRNWMLRSNYESLREASIQLEKQAKRKNLTKVMGAESTTGTSADSQSQGSGAGQKGNPKLSQALAMLVLRKNLLATKGKQPSQRPDEKS